MSVSYNVVLVARAGLLLGCGTAAFRPLPELLHYAGTTGKTTLLRYLLENSTEKIACIVNDVAAINIDAKVR